MYPATCSNVPVNMIADWSLLKSLDSDSHEKNRSIPANRSFLRVGGALGASGVDVSYSLGLS
jgi:hypothetical protein